MNSANSPVIRILLPLCLAVVGQQVFAETSVTLEAGVGASDNIGRSEDNADGAGIYTAGGQFVYDEQTQRMTADLRGSVYYIAYSKTSYDDETLGALDGTVEFTLKENMFTWLVQDNYGQQTVDPFAPVRPDNRENVNYFTTGPDFQLLLGNRTALLLGARFSDVQYEIRDLDNQRMGGTLGIERRLNESRALSLHVSSDQIDYDDVVNTDFDRQLAFMRFETEASRTSLAVDLGWNEVKTDTTSADGLYLELSGSRDLSSTTSVTGSVGSRYSDAGDIFRFYQGGDQNVGDTQDIEGIGNPFQNNYASIGMSFTKNRTSAEGSLLFSDEDYEALETPDRTRVGIRGSVTRQFRSDLDGTIGADLYKREYDLDGRSDFDSRLYGELRWQYSRTLEARIRYDRSDRRSNAVGGDYSENRVFLILGYSPGS